MQFSFGVARWRRIRQRQTALTPRYHFNFYRCGCARGTVACIGQDNAGRPSMSRNLYQQHSQRTGMRAVAAHTHRHTALLAAGLLAILALASANRALAALFVSVNVAPPALPVYVQPPIPEPGYLWVPGYWAYGPEGYYWVPGTWVEPPSPGLVWTPGYWGFSDGAYVWNAGYWGPAVGFYGGINYGYGYPGRGYYGGYWRNNQFFYNRSVTNITNVHITNVYNRTVVNNVSVSRVSYNGGRGGVRAIPTVAERRAHDERHEGLTAAQDHHAQAASAEHGLLASVNHGRPPVAATAHAASFSGPGVVGARGAAAHPQAVHATPPTKHAPHVAQAAHTEGASPHRPPPVPHGPPAHAAVAHEPAVTHEPARAAVSHEPQQAMTAHTAPHETHVAQAPHAAPAAHEPPAAHAAPPAENREPARPLHLAQAPAAHPEPAPAAREPVPHVAAAAAHRSEPAHPAAEHHENGR
jgi:WXXGXW repeat (2 copies)